MENNINLKNILTDRLILVPVTFEITQSLLDGSSKEIEKLGIKTDGKWPTRDTMRILPTEVSHPSKSLFL